MQLKNSFSNMIPKIMEEFEYQKLSISDNLEFFKPTYTRKQKTFAEEISASLNMKPKKINQKSRVGISKGIEKQWNFSINIKDYF